MAEQVFVLVNSSNKALEVVEGPHALLKRTGELVGTLDEMSKKVAGRLIEKDLTMFTEQRNTHPYISLRGIKEGAARTIAVHLGEKL